MTTPTTTQIPRGIYRFIVAGGGFESDRLTNEKYVTVRPSSVDDDNEQEWLIEHNQDGTITISPALTGLVIPYLTYEGAPKPAEPGNRIEVRVSRSPWNKWHLEPAPGFTFFIQDAGSNLGIAIAPPKIQPPFLDLGTQDQLKWRLELVREIGE